MKSSGATPMAKPRKAILLAVVGEQPVLAPGEAFRYTSGCPLETPVGSMRGTYHCVAEDGTHFDVAIPEFVLAMPRVLH